MADYVTDGGLVVRDHRRASHLPNGNVPPGTVGPDRTEPGRFVMYPEGGRASEAWNGWPVEWNPPPLEPLGTNAWSGSGYGRHDDTFGRVSTVMTCTDLNSRQLGSFPVYGVKGDSPFQLPDWSLSPEPEHWESWPQFVQAAVNSLMLRGEAITYATGRYAATSGGQIARFTLLNPDFVNVELIDGRRVVSLGTQAIPAEDVMVVRYQSLAGRLRGITPLEWAAGPLVTSSALERYAADVASRGGVPWAVLKNARQVSAQQARDAQAAWTAAAARRDGAPAVLGNDWELETLSLSPRDMALLELREFDERRIAAALGVPAYLVNIEMTSGLTYANASIIRDQHWAATLRTIANLLCSAWSRWLLPRGSRIEMNPDRYVQPGIEERSRTWATMFGIVDPVTGQRAMTIDEIRAAERLAPSGPTVAPVSQTGAQTLTGANL